MVIDAAEPPKKNCCRLNQSGDTHNNADDRTEKQLTLSLPLKCQAVG